jgi:hypothetical protein
MVGSRLGRAATYRKKAEWIRRGRLTVNPSCTSPEPFRRIISSTNRGPLSWTISAGNLTAFSDHTWSMGGGEWSLFFGSELVEEVVRLAANFPPDVSRNERYRRILGNLQGWTWATA